MVEALLVGSLCVVQLHRIAVIIAEVVIVDCSMVHVDRTLRSLLPLVGRVLGAVGPRVLCRFFQEGVDGARYLPNVLELFIA
jgi:hypothetical protein